MNWEEKLSQPIEEKDRVWIENPVKFETFVESSEFSSHPSLSKEQLYEVERLIGKDPKKIFTLERIAKVAVFLWGKGSGKGTCASLLVLYIVYVLLCMVDLHGYFGVAKEDPLSIVNVALSGKQSKRFFKRFKNRLKSNVWFKKYRLIIEGKYEAGTGYEYPDKVIQVTGDFVEFPQNLQVLSLHSQQEKWEDITIIMFVADEMSGFLNKPGGVYNADKVYRTLVMSTRELPYIGLVTSFPRRDEENDFTYKKYEEALKDQTGEMVGSKYFTWQIKPRRYYPSGKFFDFVINERSGEIVKVPIELRDKAKDIEGFKSRFLCMPGSGIGDFFSHPSYLNKIRETEPVIRTEDEFVMVGGKTRLRKKLVSYRKDSYPRIITLDAGQKESEATLFLSRRHDYILDGETVTDIIMDGIVVWTPSIKRGIIVDINNFQDLIIELDGIFNIIKVRMDHWNAAAIEANLSSKGIDCEVKNADYQAYTKYRTSVYGEGLVVAKLIEKGFNVDGDVIDIDRVRQLKLQSRVLKSKGMAKPRVAYGRQDLVDGAAHACDVLLEMTSADDDQTFAVLVKFRGDVHSSVLEDETKQFLFGKRPSGEYKQKKSSEEDDWIVPI